MVLRLLPLLLVFFCSNELEAQTILFADDFENSSAWTPPVTSPNSWTIEACAGNGMSAAGSKSLYITNGSADGGCSVSTNEAFAYNNSASGNDSILVSTFINASCADNYMLTFDYRIDGTPGEDYATLVYSTDGVNFLPIGGPLAISNVWTSTSVSLPALLDFSDFHLGFKFNFNDNTVAGLPLAVDNVLLVGDDVVNPTIVCPAFLELPVDNNCQAFAEDMTKDMIELSDNCTDSVYIVVTQNIPETTLLGGPGSSSNIILTATDIAGNSSQCNFTLFIIDEIAPNISCPGDTNIYVDSNCDGILGDYTGEAIVSDNCSALTNISVTQSPAPGLLINGAVVETIVQLTATDESGNTASCTFTARTVDTIPATIVCPTDTVVYSDLSCTGTLGDYAAGAIVSDNCVPSSSLSITQNPPASSIITGNQVITLTVNGGVPNTPQSCTFNAVLLDTLAPALICPTPVAVYANSSCEAILPDYTSSAAISDNCDAFPVINQNPMPGTTLTGVGSTLVTLTLTDASGNSSMCSFNQNVIDTVKPMITCPTDQVLAADINCMALAGDYISMVVTGDNCSSLITVSQSVSAGTSIFTTTNVIMTAEDESGNTQTCSFNLVLNDALAPSITCPPDETVSANSNCEYILGDYASTATAADNCSASGDMIYTQSPVSGTVLNAGTHTVFLFAEDENGNIGSCQFTIEVEDNNDPIISNCGANPTVYANVNCEATLGNYTGTVVSTDNCSSIGQLIITQTPTAGTTITSNTSITLEVTDEAGNSATCNITAILLDTISPSVSCPGPQSATINSSCEYAVPDLSALVGGSDNCSTLGNMTVSQNPAVGSTQNGITNVLVTLTDEAGNSNSCFTVINPIDTEAPTITCPSPAPVNNGTACDFALGTYSGMSLVLDNCPDYTISQNPPAGTVVNTGTTTITLEVTDAGGNTASCNFDLFVFETEDPVITCPSNIAGCDPVVSYSDPIFSDNCLVSMQQIDATGLSSGMTFPVGVTTLEYEAVDSSGNTASCQFTIEVFDFPSQANIQDDAIYLCDETSTVLNADAATSGTGEWTLLSGQGNFNNQFANSTGVNNIGTGTNQFLWTISTANCGSTSDTIVVVNALQDLQASTQDTLYACSSASIMLLANAPLYGIGTWTTNGSGNIQTVNSPNTSSTFQNGWQEFVWTIENQGCPPTHDTLNVFGLLAPSISTLDTLVCLENDQIVLQATGQALGQEAQWAVISGDADIDDIYSNPTTADNFIHGVTLITYSLSHPACPKKSDTLFVTGTLCDGFDPVIPSVFTPGNLDGSNDIFTIPYLDILYPECKVLIFNRWGSVVFESIGYAEAWDGTFNGEALPMGTYFYQIDLNDGSGQQFKGDISIIK